MGTIDLVGVQAAEGDLGLVADTEERQGWVLRADEASLAVVAHGLLGSVTVVQGGIETLLHCWRVLDEDAREEIMHAVMDHAVLIGASLQDLVRGLTLPDPPTTDDVEAWDDVVAVGRGERIAAGPAKPAPDARARPAWVPTYAHCPRCRYRGVYAVAGRRLIRCRYCKTVATLTDIECAEAVDDPGRFAARLNSNV